MLAEIGREPGGLVLVVDDEDHVLRFTTGLLIQLGFDVITASNGAAAVDLVHLRGDEIVLILLDVTMPGMDGAAMLSALEHEPVSVPIVLLSGYDPEELRERFAGWRVAGFLQKPYGLDEMRTTLRAALAHAPERQQSDHGQY